jgi:hypothetical protein
MHDGRAVRSSLTIVGSRRDGPTDGAPMSCSDNGMRLRDRGPVPAGFRKPRWPSRSPPTHNSQSGPGDEIETTVKGMVAFMP